MKRTIRQSVLVGFVALLGGGVLSAGFATAANATQDPPPPGSGNIEICKVLTETNAVVLPANLTGVSFAFTVSGPNGFWKSITVNSGSCSNPGIGQALNGVPTGNYVITETPISAPWYAVTAITELAGQSYLTASSLSAGTANVSVANGQTDTVTYTNTIQTGYVEVCKNAASTSGLTGSFSFSLSGPAGYAATTTVPVGSCSQPILAPEGHVMITESGSNLYVTGIAASYNDNQASSANAIVGTPNLVTGTATVNVLTSADVSTQTDINYTDDVVSLKICKTYDGSELGLAKGAATLFPFTVTGSAPAGAVAGFGPVSSYSASLTAGECSQPVAYRPGSVVTITEGVVPGSKTESITTDGVGESVNPGTESLANRTVQITVGTPITSGSPGAPTDEAVVTFQNTNAAPGPVKVCKLAGTMPGAPVVPSTGYFTFTVGAPGATTGLTTVDVPLGQCVFVGGDTTPTEYPYNTTLQVTEAPSASNITSAVSVVPTYVSTIVGSTPTATNETAEVAGSLVNVGAGANPANASSVEITTSESALTEVAFTDVDPPAAPGSGVVTVANPGGFDAGTTSAGTIAIANSVASTIGSVLGTGPSNIVTPSTAKSSVINLLTKAEVKKMSAAARKAALKTDEKLLSSTEAQLKKEMKVLAHAKGSLRTSAEKVIKTLKAQEKTLNADLKLLK